MSLRGTPVGSTGQRKIHCVNPQHTDKNPSMSYYAKKQNLHCFSCGKSYDLFDMIRMDYPECDNFIKQVQKACELFGMEFPADFGRDEAHYKTGSAIKQAIAQAERIAPPQTPDYTAQITHALQTQGVGGAYFAARGLSPQTCEKYHLYEQDGRAWLPVFADGRCVSYCGRAIEQGLEPRYKNSSGPMGIFNADYLRGEGDGGELFLTEAVFDALSVEECGCKAIALCGVGNVRKLLNLCAEHPAAANSYTMIAAGDSDEAGRRMNQELIEGLAAQGIACTALQLPEGYKDLNQLFIQDREQLKGCLAAAASADARAYAQTSAAHAVELLMDLSARRGSRVAVPTGFAKLDQMLDGGLYTGLYMLGAISSLGKTSLLLQIADFIAAHGTDVLYFSLEMGREELIAKSISRITRQQDTSTGRKLAFTARQVLRLDVNMTPERSLLLNQACAQYKKAAAALFLREGMADIGAREIRDAVRQHIRLRGARPVVMVDYLQILRPDDPRASDKQNTDRAVVELKRISRDFDLPVLAISSFNRENYRSAVSMEAFKESGAVEYSSDVLFGLQLAGAGGANFDANDAKQRSPRELELVMLKNRNGIPYARLPLSYDAKYNYFTE